MVEIDGVDFFVGKMGELEIKNSDSARDKDILGNVIQYDGKDQLAFPQTGDGCSRASDDCRFFWHAMYAFPQLNNLSIAHTGHELADFFYAFFFRNFFVKADELG